MKMSKLTQIFAAIGLCILGSSMLSAANTDAASAMAQVRGAAMVQPGTVIIATAQGIVMQKIDGAQTNSERMNDQDVRAVAAGPRGQAFAITAHGGVLCSDASYRQWRRIRNDERDELNPQAKVSLIVDRDNVIYLAVSAQGVVRSSDDGKTWVELKDGRNGFEDLTCLSVDSYGNVLAGTTDRGVLQYNEQRSRWENLSMKRNNLPFVESLTVLSDGTILVGGSNDIYRSQDQGATWIRTQLFDIPDGAMDNAVDAFGAPDAGRLYASTSAGIFESTDNGVKWQLVHQAVDNDPAQQFLCFGSHLCARTAKGIVRVQSVHVTPSHQG